MIKVIRPILFFCSGEEISKEKLQQFFTQHAIMLLYSDGFIIDK